MKKNVRQKKAPLFRQTKKVLSNEDWYPTREDGTIDVSLLELTNGKWRVCCWGHDDFGLERDFPTKEEAARIYARVCDLTTQNTLRDTYGFYPA